jgi:hypothetical protein
MDTAAFVGTLEDEKRTELDRLGSAKLLVALTDADLTAQAVLETAAQSEFAARETFRAWAADESNDRAREAFERTVDREAEHYERVVAELDDEFEPADPGAMHAYLRQRETTAERVVTGMIARSMVSVRVHGQIVSFFVNEPDERRAALFRELQSETEDTLQRGTELLADVATDADAEGLQAAASYVIKIAYDEYADALTALDIDPKPVC